MEINLLNIKRRYYMQAKQRFEEIARKKRRERNKEITLWLVSMILACVTFYLMLTSLNG